MKIIGLGAGPTDPATRFRICNHIELFQKQGISAKYIHNSIPKFGIPNHKINYWLSKTNIPLNYYWDIFRFIQRAPILKEYFSTDYYFLNRFLIPSHITYERILYNKLIFDFDDAIWLGEGKDRIDKVIKKSKFVFVGNSYLYDYAKQYNPTSTFVIPTPVDSCLYVPKITLRDKFVFGWIGSQSNLCQLSKISTHIIQFLNQFNDVEFKYMSTEPLSCLNHKRIIFHTWSVDDELHFIQSLELGLMPLENNEWSLGKCSYKMLQYMSCGIPVLVSSVGMNKELLMMDEIGIGLDDFDLWFDALKEFYYISQEDRIQMGVNGRRIVEQHFDLALINNRILNIIKK